MTFPHDWQTQHGKQPIVKLLQSIVRWLERRANQVWRDAFLAPLELALVKEPQPGR
jgi:hypothetical protein